MFHHNLNSVTIPKKYSAALRIFNFLHGVFQTLPLVFDKIFHIHVVPF